MRSVPEWIGRTSDSAIPPRVRDRIVLKAERVCQHCMRPVGAHLAARFDHIVPLILGGENRETNIQLLCEPCHAAKTGLDVKLKSRVASVRKKHLGIKKPRTIRAWRKFDGTPVFAGRLR